MANENNKKIPCGGFYLGDGLTMDGDTLKSLGGEQVQTDWNQNDTTAKDYIKNRPGGYTKTTPGYEITWDGIVGDAVVVDLGEMQFVKVSDRVFTVEELTGATMIFGDRSLIVSNDAIISQNGIITNEVFLVCSAPTTIDGITVTETGTYFVKMGEAFVSSLSKPDSTTTIKIPAELTTVVGGYDREARTDALFNGVVKPSDFVDAGTLPTGKTQYCALITLATSLIDGSTVTGNVNGVEVSGEISGKLRLYDVDDNIVLIIGAIGNMTTCALPDYSIPSSDLVISLTQSVQVGPVVIPEKYLDLERVNGHISYAQMTAETAYNKAETAQSTANTAKTTANTAQSTANTAKTTAEAAKTTAEAAKTTAENAVHGSIQRLPNATSLNYYLTPSDTTADSIDSVRTFIGLPAASSLEIIVKDKTNPSVTFTPPVYLNHQADFAFARATNVYPHPQITEIGGIVMYSTTSGSTKKFRITVDDTGTIKATEVTAN